VAAQGHSNTSVLSPHVIVDSADNWACTLLQKRDPQLLNYRLAAIEHRKNECSPYHEYVQVNLLCITDKNTRDVRYARVDRSFQRNPASVRNSYRSLFQGHSLSADDTIIITRTPQPTGSFSLFSMYFDYDMAPTIVDFATVLLAVTSLAPNYNLDTTCYWAARMVFDGLAEAFDGQIELGQKPDRRGKFSRHIRLVERRGELRLTGLRNLIRTSASSPLPTRHIIANEIHRLREQLELTWERSEAVERERRVATERGQLENPRSHSQVKTLP